MNETPTTKTSPAKPSATKPSPAEFDQMFGRERMDHGDLVRVRELFFRGSVDIGRGRERTQVARLQAHDGSGGKARCEILFVPRIRMFHVRLWDARFPGDAQRPPTYTMLIPGDWAVAELEPTA